MVNRAPLSVVEKERIYFGKMEGKTLEELAQEVGCSTACARKWWRVGRDHGLKQLRAPRRGRGPTGVLSRFEQQVVKAALKHKQAHPRWGPDRVLVAMEDEPKLSELALPSRSRLAVFFKSHCPELVVKRQRKKKSRFRPLQAQKVHELWQMDNQEAVRLSDGQIATICSVRDPVGAAMLASQAFAVKTAKRWRKLTIEEMRQVLRGAFAEWGTLPDAVLTDNEATFGGNPWVSFPSPLTLWLVGLGVEHRFIRPGQPTDQPHIERQHRTLNDFTFGDKERATINTLQKALDRERRYYNHRYPSRASHCAGRPPLEAFPQLKKPRRPYQPDHELVIFSQQRILDFMAGHSFERTAGSTGQVRIGGYRYAISRRYSGLQVSVCLDPVTKEWLFHISGSYKPIARRKALGLDFHSLSGLDPDRLPSPKAPLQLALPFTNA